VSPQFRGVQRHTTAANIAASTPWQATPARSGSNNEAIFNVDTSQVSPPKFIFGAKSKGKALPAVHPTMNNPLGLETGVHQVAPNLRRTISYHPEIRNVPTEPPGTVVSTGKVNRLSVPPRVGSMTDRADQINPNTLVATDPKVIRGTMANGLIATRENQDDH